MRVALTRAVPPSIVRCQLTHIARAPIDVGRAVRQHRDYEAALVAAGCRVERLAAEPDLPDSVFVEDTAVVLEEVAVVSRPGAASRRPETESVAAALAPYRPLASIQAPGTLDGGDVLVAGRTVLVGVGGRTNTEGAAELERHVAPHGYTVRRAEVRGCLHLKSAATLIAPSTVLVNPAWVDPTVFEGLDHVAVDPAEPAAANTLLVGTTLLVALAFPRTRERLEHRGITTHAVDLGELAKAEGALTCCSVIFTTPGDR